MKPDNTLNLSLKFTSIAAITSFINKLPAHTNNISNIRLESNTPLFLPYMLSQGIMDCVKTIMPDLRECNKVKYTKALSLGIGLITSAVVSVGYNGMDYILNFSLSFIKTSATTMIIDKFNKIHFDGVSVIILIEFIMNIPKIIMGVSSAGLVGTLLFLLGLGVCGYATYKSLQSTEGATIHWNGKIDKLSISTRNSVTTSLVVSNLVSGLVPGGMVVRDFVQLTMSVLVQWFLSGVQVDLTELNKALRVQDAYIGSLKHGEETDICVRKMVRSNALKLGLVSEISVLIIGLLFKVFMISVSPVVVVCTLNSLINVRESVKSELRGDQLKRLIN